MFQMGRSEDHFSTVLTTLYKDFQSETLQAPDQTDTVCQYALYCVFLIQKIEYVIEKVYVCVYVLGRDYILSVKVCLH